MLNLKLVDELLDVWGLAEINRIQMVLTRLTEAGVTDVRVAQDSVQKYLDRKHRENKSDLRRRTNRKDRILGKRLTGTYSKQQQKAAFDAFPNCPECDEKMLPVQGVKEKIWACKACGFSRLVEE